MNERFAKFGIFILQGYSFISLKTSIDKDNERIAKLEIFILQGYSFIFLKTSIDKENENIIGKVWNIQSVLAVILKTSIDTDSKRIAKFGIFLLLQTSSIDKEKSAGREESNRCRCRDGGQGLLAVRVRSRSDSVNNCCRSPTLDPT